MSETLKSCPFCGSDRIFERGFRCFECPDCRAEGPPKATRAEAVSAWNTRSDPPADLKAVREVLEPFARARANSGSTLTVADFDRAAEVYAALNLSETPAPGSLALGAVPEGGEERNSSSVDESGGSPPAAAKSESQHSAGGEG